MTSSSDLSLRRSKTKAGVLADYLYKKFHQRKWFDQEDDSLDREGSSLSCLGVVMKSEDGSYTSEPQTLDRTIIKAVEYLQTRFAVTMRSGAITALLEQSATVNGEILLNKFATSLPLVDSAAQILKTPLDPRVDGRIFLCKKEMILLLCTEHSQDLLRRGSNVEDMIIAYLLGNPLAKSRTQSQNGSFDHSRDSEIDRLRKSRGLRTQRLPYLSQNALKDDAVVEMLSIIQTAVEKEELGDRIFDPKKEGQEAPKRKMLLNHALIVGASLVLVVVVEMTCIAQMIREAQLMAIWSDSL